MTEAVFTRDIVTGTGQEAVLVTERISSGSRRYTISTRLRYGTFTTSVFTLLVCSLLSFIISIKYEYVLGSSDDDVAHTWIWGIIFLISALFATLVLASHRNQSHTLYVCRGIGVQLSTTKGLWSSGTNVFYPCAAIEDLVINEAITCHRILIYGVLLIRPSGGGDQRLEVLFPQLIPRLKDLVQICNECREILFDEAVEIVM